MSAPLLPLDEYNTALLANVHPADWVNPKPAGKYNLVVIGAGTAGLVTAAGAAGVGAKVALIERHLMGGDCLNVGCVPSKALIASAKRAWLRGESGQEVFARAMTDLRQRRASISPHDSAARFRDLGIDVFLGQAEFTGDHAVTVAGQRLDFARAVIASGARAAVPDLPGLAEAGFLTNETVFNLTELPRRLAVIGGGPIGCELAQAFCRLGAEVTLIHRGRTLLDREDADAARIVQDAFVREGVRLVLDAATQRVGSGPGGKTLHWVSGGVPGHAEVDGILVAAGRTPNLGGLGLERAGVQADPREGVRVDDHLRTTNPHIYAAGDVCMRWKFTHAADFAARIVIQNALFFGRKKLSALNMPWATYTDPEIAHTGLYQAEAEAEFGPVNVWTREFRQVDRAIAEGETAGFVRILTPEGKGKIVGATIVGPHAGDLISQISVAMAAGMSLGSLASVIHPYPTRAEAIRQLGDAYNRTRLTPRVKRILAAITRWRR